CLPFCLSSRRRHTRLSRDWSSDVCSSDLLPDVFEARKKEIQRKYIPEMVLASPDKFESVWNEYVSELNKLDIAGYEAWFTEQVKIGRASCRGRGKKKDGGAW